MLGFELHLVFQPALIDGFEFLPSHFDAFVELVEYCRLSFLEGCDVSQHILHSLAHKLLDLKLHLQLPFQLSDFLLLLLLVESWWFYTVNFYLCLCVHFHLLLEPFVGFFGNATAFRLELSTL